MSENLPAWLKSPAPEFSPAAPASSVANEDQERQQDLDNPTEATTGEPAAGWLAPEDRLHPEPGTPDPAVVAETMQTAATGWKGPTVGKPIPASVGGPDPDPAPIREPGDEPPADTPEQEPEEGYARIETITQGLLLFKRLWLWPAGTQNELEAAKEFSTFIVAISEEFKRDGSKSQ